MWGGPPLPEPKGPGLLKRAANFAGAVARHALDLGRHVSEEQYQHRLATCRGCPFHASGDRCRHPKCGCVLKGDLVAKARWRSEDCPEKRWRQWRPAPAVRNLLYHVYPVRGNGLWQWNVNQLLRRIDLFNGKRVVAVAYDGGTDTPDAVRQTFGKAITDFIAVPNQSSLREVLTFEPLMRQVVTDDATQATLWAHAKGVTRPPSTPCRRWAEVQYETYLDHWPRVARLLETYPVAGSFLKVGHGWPAHESRSDWHYSGSWLWFRNRDVFSLPKWTEIDRFWSGIEPYPSLHFGLCDAGNIFHRGTVPELDLYSDDYWRRVVEPAYARWKIEREREAATASEDRGRR